MAAQSLTEQTTTRLKLHLEQRHWKYERFRQKFEDAANELGLGNLTIGRRQVERWIDGSLKSLPRADACLVLEHLFGEPVPQLLAPVQAAGDSQTIGRSVRDPIPLRVAIGIVINDGAVLLVRRRSPEGALDWQFPAGIVKPSQTADQVVVKELIAETGITAKVQARLGARVHPVTAAECEYFLCTYLHGTVTNRDLDENAEVAWVPSANLDRYIEPDLIYPPARQAVTSGSTQR